MNKERIVAPLFTALETVEPIKLNGAVCQVIGLTIEANGPVVEMGDLCFLLPRHGRKKIPAEVVGFRDKKVILMPLGDLTGIGPGSKVVAAEKKFTVPVGPGLLGRVLSGLGEPIDGKGHLSPIEGTYPVHNNPPNPLTRRRIRQVLPIGVRAIDGLLTLGRGQRMGIFAGSGVGKSTLLGMVARNTAADINVIALVGERGREVREFLERDLGDEGLAHSVVVVATSDQPALVRLKAAYVATAIAEYFRDLGKDVLLLMDSVTRFCMAQREVGLAIGEPPVSRGYTPSVFAILPKLLERAGNSEKGSITGLYTVLVDGDDLTEPVTDTVRGILDGHIVLSRKLANNNHFPAIDVLSSISRLMTEITPPKQRDAAGKLRGVLAAYQEAEDLIRIGAYQAGTSPQTDFAIANIPRVLQFLQQDISEKVTYMETIEQLLHLFE